MQEGKTISNFADDLGAAIVETINDLSSAFSALGNTGGTLHAEYASQEVNYNRGAAGTCLVKPLDEEPVGPSFGASGQSLFVFELDFGLVDVMDSINARTSVQQALRKAFGDNGTRLYANLVDSGSNGLGGSLQVNRPIITLVETEDPDRPQLLARLEIKAWPKVDAT